MSLIVIQEFWLEHQAQSVEAAHVEQESNTLQVGTTGQLGVDVIHEGQGEPGGG